jgi:quercetin dioxygenase-like cupin family protein
MKIYYFGADVGRSVPHYDSNFIINILLRTTGELPAGAEVDAPGHSPGTIIKRRGVQISCMHIPAGGVVGYHQASVPQLFLVVAGEGWVRGEAPERTKVTTDYAAFWETGEWHESGSDAGMTAIVIEGEELHPKLFVHLLIAEGTEGKLRNTE